MRSEFLFRLTPMDSANLVPQVSRVLEKRAELKSRQVCPGLWKVTDRLNTSCRNVPKRFGLFHNVMIVVLTLLGLFLCTPFLLDPAALLFPGLLGTAAYLWGLFSMYRHWHWSVLPILLLHGILATVSGRSLTRTDGSGKWLLCVGIMELVVFLVLLLPHRQRKVTSFERAASSLLEHRVEISDHADVTILFGPDSMEVSGADPVPYSQFEGIFETEDLLLFIFQDKVMVLQKSELISGSLSELRDFLAEHISFIRV